MSVIVLKYKLNGLDEIKLFKNEVSYKRFAEKMTTDGSNLFTIISKSLDNRATRTIKRLMNVPKRKPRQKSRKM